MDDPRTQETLDALADLFLTNIQSSAPQDDPLSGPAPIKLVPKPAQGQADEPQLRLHRPERERAAALEASDQADEDEAVDREPPAASVEAVLLGNLPGLAGPWLTQYGQLLAQQHGPVVILHVDEQRIEVELVEPVDRGTVGDPVARFNSQMPPYTADRIDLVQQLDRLLRSDPQRVRTILVHLDPFTEPSDLTRALCFDDWTLLCGADDTAIVGAHRLLKQLMGSDPSASGKHVGLMVMGSNQQAARTAANKIQVAATSFLQTPVELIGWQQQMVPVNLCQVGTWDEVDQLWPCLVDFFARLDERPDAVDEPISGSIPHAATKSRMNSARAADLKLHAVPESLGDRADTVEPDLASFLTAGDGIAPGGVMLEARCPLQTQAQLLVDQSGCLHLLRCHSTGDDIGEADLQVAVLDLIQLRNWANEHIELLQLTQRQLRFDIQSEPVLHLFTDRADLGTALITRLGQFLKLHLLREVRVGSHHTWFCAPLN